MIEEHAAAKVNLALHVTGRRADGYHLIETLAVFCSLGDVVTVDDAGEDRFEMSGPFAAGLHEDTNNLVVAARDAVRRACGVSRPVSIRLEKNLPIAAGIGGGSADAAAALRALTRLWKLDAGEIAKVAPELGADVAMCLESRPLLASGAGETVAPLSAFPALHLVLVNPLVPVSTPSVFAALSQKINPPLAPLPALSSPNDVREYLPGTRNDLECPARSIEPAVGKVLAALQAAEALFVRMSGSGATCFGLFADADGARDAEDRLQRAHPDWYVRATQTGAGDVDP